MKLSSIKNNSAEEILKNFRTLSKPCFTNNIPTVNDNYELSIIMENNELTNILFKITVAFNSLEKLERQIIYEKYMATSKEKDVYIYMKLNLSERTFYRIKKKALKNFEFYFFNDGF